MLSACGSDDPGIDTFELKSAFAGSIQLNLEGADTEDIPVDRTINLIFSEALDAGTVETGITLRANSQVVNASISLSAQNTTASISTAGTLLENTTYTIVLNEVLKSAAGSVLLPFSFNFKTQANELEILSVTIGDQDVTNGSRAQNIATDFAATFSFSTSVDISSFEQALSLPGVSFSITPSDNNRTILARSTTNLAFIKKYTLDLSNALKSTEGGSFDGYSLEFYTEIDPTPKFPEISEEALLTKIQEQTFKYFWDFAHPISGMARERNTSNETVTTGGSGFGIMSILVGIERGFITRVQGMERMQTIVNFLKSADRFHGVWPHWINGSTGEVIPFSASDNGGDLVETAFMVQGLLTVRQYLDNSNPQEASIISNITQLWQEVEWDWYTKGGENVLYWHWSPDLGWQISLKIRGWNESLIVYALAAASPTHPISPAVYHEGWARDGAMTNGGSFYNTALPLGSDRGGPLFFSHYSFLGLDPRDLVDQYASYWTQNTAHSTINQSYCQANPLNYVGYTGDCWGLTASDNHLGYSAHSPNNDLGVITPTAAISSIPYTPEESMNAIKHFYYLLGDKLWGDYGFYDAFNLTEEWVAGSYLAIDQGPIILMIENHRTALLWDLFMQNTEVTDGLDKLGFTSY
ncbi:MAG: hypothetical protein HEP71_10850 [Roseivirga sp.]|nr:hypothetical protein [Roseivirga sp.]